MYKRIKGVAGGKVRYQFYLRHDGQRFRKVITCKPSLVKTYHKKWEDKIENNLTGNFKLFEKLDEFLEHIKDTKPKYAYEAEKFHVRLFKKYFRDIPLHDFRRHHVEGFIAWRKKHPQRNDLNEVQPSTIVRNIASLSCFFTFCIVREYYVRVNPCYKNRPKVRNEREIRLTQKQIDELLDNAEGKLYTAVLLSLLCGLRRGEIFNLRWSHIDFSTSLINLPKEFTKSHKRRVVCMPDFLEEHLKTVRKENPFSDRIFFDWKTLSKFRSEWDRLRNKLSFQTLENGLTLHFHDLRHIYAQSLRDAGVPMGDIQTLLGHSSIRVTEERYAQFGGVDAKNKVNKIQNILKLVDRQAL